MAIVAHKASTTTPPLYLACNPSSMVPSSHQQILLPRSLLLCGHTWGPEPACLEVEEKRKEARRIFRMEKQRRTRRWKKTCMNASEKTCVLVTLSQPCLSALPLPHALLSYLSHGGKYPHLGGVSHAPKTVKVNLGTCVRVRVKERSGDRTHPGFNLSCQRTAADEKHLEKKTKFLQHCPSARSPIGAECKPLSQRHPV